jgi:L-ribulokinase
MEIAESAQTVALGAAIVGGFVGMKGKEQFESIEEIQSRVCKVKENIFIPNPNSAEVYSKLYKLYTRLHDSFGKDETNNLFDIMKQLIEIKKNESLKVGN